MDPARQRGERVMGSAVAPKRKHGLAANTPLIPPQGGIHNSGWMWTPLSSGVSGVWG